MHKIQILITHQKQIENKKVVHLVHSKASKARHLFTSTLSFLLWKCFIHQNGVQHSSGVQHLVVKNKVSCLISFLPATIFRPDFGWKQRLMITYLVKDSHS